MPVSGGIFVLGLVLAGTLVDYRDAGRGADGMRTPLPERQAKSVPYVRLWA